MTTIGSDNFTRANDPSAWGISSGGATWNKIIGNDLPAISGNEGQITSVSSAFDTIMQYGSTSAGNITNLITVQIAAQNSGPIWRLQDTGSYYRAVIEGGTLFVQSAASFSFNTIGSQALTGFSSADFWNIFISHIGQALECWAWKASDSQPINPTISTTDNTYMSGKFGLTSVGNGSGTNFYTHFLATDGAVPPPQNAAPVLSNHRVIGRFI